MRLRLLTSFSLSHWLFASSIFCCMLVRVFLSISVNSVDIFSICPFSSEIRLSLCDSYCSLSTSSRFIRVSLDSTVLA